MLAVQLRGVLLCATVFAAACGEDATPPAPAAVPEEFDDPFADEAKEAKVEAPAAAKGEETKVAPTEPAAVAVAEAGPGAPQAAGVDGAVAPASAAAPEPAAVAAKTESAAGPAKAVESDKAAAKKSKPPGESSPVPKDKSPTPEPPVPADSLPPTPAPTPTPVATPAPAAPAQPDQARFAGTFRYAGGEAQRQKLTEAIEAVVQELNALIRGIGRKRLTEANPIREQMTFAVDGNKVTATFAAGRTISGTLGGPPVPWTSDGGKPLTVAFSLVKGRLVMDYKAEDGGRRSTFTLDESGDKLTMSVTITSERLTNPLKYALSYRRN